jgi:hypothetical protein
MSETRKITIEIIQTNKSTGTTMPTEQTNKDDVDQKKASGEGATLLKSFILNQGYQTAKKMIIGTVEASISNYLTLSEDYMAENTINKVKTAISKVTSIGGTILSSTLAGAQMGGGVGAVAGMVIGSTTAVYNEVLSYQTRMSSYYQSLNASNISKDYAKRRSGYVDSGKGTEN